MHTDICICIFIYIFVLHFKYTVTDKLYAFIITFIFHYLQTKTYMFSSMWELLENNIYIYIALAFTSIACPLHWSGTDSEDGKVDRDKIIMVVAKPWL